MPFAFCLLPFAFCLLPFAFCLPAMLLSSYPLSPANNERIAGVAGLLGLRFVPSLHGEERDAVIAQIDEHVAEATIYLGGSLSQQQLDQAEELRWIQVPWAGVNRLMALDLSARPDLLLTNSPVMADAVADQTLAYLLMLNRSLPQQIVHQTKSEWVRYRTVEHPDRRRLRGMTLGILGYGSIGRAIAARARAFGMRIVACKNRVDDGVEWLDRVYPADERDAMLAESDFVVIALPLTDETRRSFARRAFRAMKPTACLVNIARGAIVDQGALVAALESGEIAGAALDAHDPEPLPVDSVLWKMPGVIVTPHSSGGFVGFGDEVATLFCENLRRFGQGDPLLNRVDRERGY